MKPIRYYIIITFICIICLCCSREWSNPWDDSSNNVNLRNVPSVTTSNVTNITENSAISGGQVSSENYSIITNRGICLSKNQNPTIDDVVIYKGTGLGTLNCDLINLNSGTTYYVRAFAINSIGIGYGNEIKFTTAIPPKLTVTTNSVSAIAMTTAICGGNVTMAGKTSVIQRGVCWNTAQNPTINNIKTTDSLGLGKFTSRIYGLIENTNYFVRSYAINSNDTAYGNEISFTTKPLHPLSISDFDGNVYKTVTIGTQIWMAENLKVSHYNNGDLITQTLDTITWQNQANIIGERTILSTESSYLSTYGYLYNWLVVADSRNVCPIDWHIPSKDEWNLLINYLGGNNSITCNSLKEVGTTHWLSPNGGNNLSGFNALPGGRFPVNADVNIGLNNAGSWWSNTSIDLSTAWGYTIGQSWISEYKDIKDNGFSIRCIKN
jgi:uncharacterized protein (TIGR02145 family)